MARKVSWASSSSRWSFLTCSGSIAPSALLRAARTSARGSDGQSDENTLGVREVSDDLAHGLGQTADQRRHGEDLIPCRELRVLDQVDDLDPVSPGQMLLADSLEIGECGDRSWCLPRDVEAQNLGLAGVLDRWRARARTLFSHFHPHGSLTFASSFRFERSPPLPASARRLLAMSLLSSFRRATRAWCWMMPEARSACSVSNLARSAASSASNVVLSLASARWRRSSSCSWTSAAACSSASRLKRADPVRTPTAPA